MPCSASGTGCPVLVALGAALRMKELYTRWAAARLARDEECVTRFCHFLTTNFGLRFAADGLRWVATMLKERKTFRTLVPRGHATRWWNSLRRLWFDAGPVWLCSRRGGRL